MRDKTVLVLGAGATKAVGGPLTREILPHAFQLGLRDREDLMQLLDQFLVENFHLPSDRAARVEHDYPALPALISLLDIALERKQPFGAAWGLDRLASVREALEYAIFTLIKERLQQNPTNQHFELFQRLAAGGGPHVISLNYDVVADNALMAVGRMQAQNAPSYPEYECDIVTGEYQRGHKWGRLLKLHGSLNWSYCPNCHAMEIGISGRWMMPEGWDVKQVFQCEACNTLLRTVLVAPTHRKDYRNPHIAQVWYKAERLLRQAQRVVFIGYSLPDDDVEVMYLLKRGLWDLRGPAVTVIEYDEQRRTLDQHEVGRRYRNLFGPGVDWNTDGMVAWLGRAQLP
jgi:NAD-dependent SIR2 family protein deacetylase